MYFQSFVLQMNELLTIYYQHLCNQWFGLLHMLHIQRMEPCRVYSGNLLHYSGLFRTILHCTSYNLLVHPSYFYVIQK